MRIVPTLDGFMSDQVESCCIATSSAIWCTCGIVGVIKCGIVDRAYVRELRDAIALADQATASSCVAVFADCREVERADEDAILELESLARDAVPRWSPRLDRQVVVVPPNLTGILLAGVLSTHAPRNRLHITHDLADAYDSIGDPHARETHELALSLSRDVWGRSSLVARIRAMLADDLSSATIETCSSRIGISGRSLQRELLRAGTSFSDELRRARALAARELLIHTDLKVDVIATRIGLKSRPRMNAILRREFDNTPLELRLRGSRPISR
jgi:AraC-like DNA-binding protein